MSTPAQKRRAILDEWWTLRSGWEELSTQTLSEESQQRWTEQIQQAAALREGYLELVPTVPLSRCPFTNDVVEYPIDTHGLDGAWWDFEQPARPDARPPETLWALWGAVSVKGEVMRAPFLCKPGPAVPYVLPELLGKPNVKAVLSKVVIGKSHGYAVACYVEGDTEGLKRPAAWGSETLSVRNQTERGITRRVGDKDFDLAPWIESGNLLWIAPGDGDLTLRDTTEGCKYLGLAGTHGMQRIQAGKLWTPGEA